MDIEAADATIDINNTAGDGDPAINFQLSGTTTFSVGVNDGEADEFRIGTSDLEDAQTRFGIDASGNIGIGTVTYTALLNVDGSAIFNESGADVDFRVEGDTEANLLFVDGSADAVGIGTTSPTARLHVDGAGTADGASILTITSDGDRDFQIRNPVDGDLNSPWQFQTGNAYEFIVDGLSTITINSGGDIKMGSTGNTDMFSLDYSTDRIGIGTSTPGYTLDVSGTINHSGAITNVSDKRYKKDINKIDNALGLIAQFDGYNYKFRKDEFPALKFDTTAQIGFIAQEIQKALPQLVSENDSGYLSVNYIKVVPILLMGMKEQQAIIEAQKKENESQKQEIETIKAEASTNTTETAQKLAALEAKLNALLLLNSKGAVLTAEN